MLTLFTRQQNIYFRYFVTLAVLILLTSCGQNQVSPTPKEEAVNEPLKKNPVDVALLVPKTGTSGAIGQDLINAAQLALFDAGYKGFTMRPYDTVGTPEGAEIAAKQAIHDGAKIIVGPLFSKTTKVVAPLAHAAGINVLSFSNNKDVARSDVFVLGLLPEDQIHQMVTFAMKRGIRDFATFAPQSDYGKTTTDLFVHTVESLGGNIIQQGTYANEISDVTVDVQKFLNAHRPLSHRDEQAKENADYGLIKAPFQAIFMPDQAKKVAIVASLLSHHGLDLNKVKLLGTSEWQPRGKPADIAMSGAWFTTTQEADLLAFDKRFADTYGYTPNRHASLAFDAVALAARLAQGVKTKVSRTALLDPRGFKGVNGIFRMTETGRVERKYTIVEITNSGTRTVSSGGFSF